MVTEDHKSDLAHLDAVWQGFACAFFACLIVAACFGEGSYGRDLSFTLAGIAGSVAVVVRAYEMVTEERRKRRWAKVRRPIVKNIATRVCQVAGSVHQTLTEEGLSYGQYDRRCLLCDPNPDTLRQITAWMTLASQNTAHLREGSYPHATELEMRLNGERVIGAAAYPLGSPHLSRLRELVPMVGLSAGDSILILATTFEMLRLADALNDTARAHVAAEDPEFQFGKVLPLFLASIVEVYAAAVEEWNEMARSDARLKSFS